VYRILIGLLAVAALGMLVAIPPVGRSQQPAKPAPKPMNKKPPKTSAKPAPKTTAKPAPKTTAKPTAVKPTTRTPTRVSTSRRYGTRYHRPGTHVVRRWHAGPWHQRSFTHYRHSRQFYHSVGRLHLQRRLHRVGKTWVVRYRSAHWTYHAAR
jgi:hypothetical protein